MKPLDVRTSIVQLYVQRIEACLGRTQLFAGRTELRMRLTQMDMRAVGIQVLAASKPLIAIGGIWRYVFLQFRVKASLQNVHLLLLTAVYALLHANV